MWSPPTTSSNTKKCISQTTEDKVERNQRRETKTCNLTTRLEPARLFWSAISCEGPEMVEDIGIQSYSIQSSNGVASYRITTNRCFSHLGDNCPSQRNPHLPLFWTRSIVTKGPSHDPSIAWTTTRHVTTALRGKVPLCARIGRCNNKSFCKTRSQRREERSKTSKWESPRVIDEKFVRNKKERTKSDRRTTQLST